MVSSQVIGWIGIILILIIAVICLVLLFWWLKIRKIRRNTPQEVDVVKSIAEQPQIPQLPGNELPILPKPEIPERRDKIQDEITRLKREIQRREQESQREREFRDAQESISRIPNDGDVPGRELPMDKTNSDTSPDRRPIKRTERSDEQDWPSFG